MLECVTEVENVGRCGCFWLQVIIGHFGKCLPLKYEATASSWLAQFNDWKMGEKLALLCLNVTKSAYQLL